MGQDAVYVALTDFLENRGNSERRGKSPHARNLPVVLCATDFYPCGDADPEGMANEDKIKADIFNRRDCSGSQKGADAIEIV
jgi:hypothetical protein